MRWLSGCCKALGLAILILLVIPTQSLVLLFSRGPGSYRLPQLWHRCACSVLGIEVEVVGQVSDQCQAVFVGNHLSYLDIPVVGSFIRAAFTAKSDMRDWPLLGFLAGLQQTVFISRAPRHASVAADSLSRAMRGGNSLIVFAEGTTSIGDSVGPFKSSLFSILTGEGQASVLIQPFTLQLLEIDGRPARDVEDKDVYAYYREMQLASHLWAFMRVAGARVRLVFHEPICSTPDMSRKTLADLTRRVVSSAIRTMEPAA